MDAKFTPEEEARIQAEVDAAEKARREQEIQDEIRNRIADAERNEPGHQY